MKRYLRCVFIFVLVLNFVTSCKTANKSNDGSFAIVNYSNKVINFIWIAPEGTFYQTAKEINVGYGDDYEINHLEAGVYDIALDFEGEYNSFNSKKDKSKVLKIERGIRKVWVVNADGTMDIN